EESDEASLGYAVPLLLELSPKLYNDFLHDDRWRRCFNHLYPRLRQELTQRLGIPLPELKIAVNEELLQDRYVIKIYEIPVDEGFLSPEHCLVQKNDQLPNWDTLMSEHEAKETNTVHGSKVMLIENRHQQNLGLNGIRAFSPEEVLLKHIARVVVKQASDFVGVQEVKDVLSHVERRHPDLVREVIPRMLTVQKLTEVIKRLVDEGVSVKDFRLLLETLTVVRPEDKSAVDLTELVRMGLKRQITHRYTNRSGMLSCFGLDPEIEEEVAKHIKKTGQDCFLTLPPNRIEAITRAARLAYRSHRASPKKVVVLTNPEIRRYVRKMLELELPDVSVLSYQEIEPTILIDQKDTISLNYPEMVMSA
ncbi:MAG TPA: FHIPEP family type III secretion protein, partial [bacterium]|nr:FHIPEP family type III secretion protein [bacterium]